MKSLCAKVGLLCLATAMMSIISASAAMAVTIKPAGDKIQLKATNMKLHWIGGEKEKDTTCELWQTAGKINALGTLPVALEVPTFGKGKGECTIYYGGLALKGRVISAQAEELNASSKTAASIAHNGFTIELETSRGEKEENCVLEVGYHGAYEGVWTNGTSKEKPSTLAISVPNTEVRSRNNCYLWGAASFIGSLSATFSVTDTTEPNKVVVLE